MQVIFLLTAALTLGAAMMMVSTRSLIHAALWLILALFGVTIAFVLLEAGFFAVVQVVVYIGAIAILMIFAIMLTRRELRDHGNQSSRAWGLGALISLALFGGLTWMLSAWSGFTSVLPEAVPSSDNVALLGQALVSPNGYVLPFEVASFLLLAAMVGAIYAAWDKK